MPESVPVNPAFERRVRHAVAMLLNNSLPRDVQQKHGAFVLQSAQHEIQKSSVKPDVPRWA